MNIDLVDQAALEVAAGDVAESNEDDDEAEKRFSAGLSILEVLHSTDERFIEGLSLKATCSLGLGDVELRRKALVDARSHFTRAMEVGKSILNRAVQARAVSRLPDGNKSVIKALDHLSDCLQRLHRVEYDTGRHKDACSHYQSLLKLHKKICTHCDKSHGSKLELSDSFARIGGVEELRGQKDLAKTRYQRCVALDREILSLVGENAQTLQNACSSLQRFGTLAATVAEKYDNHKQLLPLSRKIHALGETTISARNLLNILKGLAKIEDERGEFASVFSRTIEIASLLAQLPSQSATLPLEAMQISLRILKYVVAGTPFFDDVETLFECRDPLWRNLAEFCELANPETLERVQPYIANFHEAWLWLSLDYSPNRITEVIGAMQGRKILSYVMAEFEHLAASNPRSEKHQRYLGLRRKLRQQALGLKLLKGGGGGGEIEGVRFCGGQFIAPEDHGASLEQYRAIQIQYRQARAEISKSELEKIVLSVEAPQFIMSTLQSNLQPHEGLLLLVHTKHNRPLQLPDTAHGVYISGQRLEVVKLPGLVAAALALEQRSRPAAVRRLGVRDCLQSLEDSVEIAAPDSATLDLSNAQLMQQFLWIPLCETLGSAIAGLGRLHVVTQGNLHSLPLSLEAPVSLSLYPGLIFYWKQRQSQPAAVHPLDGLKIKVYSPPDGSIEPGPIPFVQAEELLVEQSWTHVDHDLNNQRIGAPVALHIACHGHSGQQGEPPFLIVGESDRLGFMELLQGDVSAPIVYLSACLVGRTQEDVDGDPLGLVSAFFLRGARTVIASLVPIDDFFAPILAHLFYRCLNWQSQLALPLDGVVALATAKSQLLSGLWYPAHLQADEAVTCEKAIVSSVCQAYVKPLSAHLKAVIKRRNTPMARMQAIRQTIEQMLITEEMQHTFICKNDAYDLNWKLVELLMKPDGSEAALYLIELICNHRKRFCQLVAIQSLVAGMHAFGDSNSTT